MKLKQAILAVVAAAIGTGSGLAQAAAMLSISDGTTTIQIADGSLLDDSTLEGVVVFNGAVGNWIVNVDTGISKPVLGSASEPSMDFNFVDLSSGTGGTLTLMFTDTDYVGTGTLSASASIGGTTDGSVAYRTYADSANVAFGMEQLLTSQVFGGPAYSATSSGTFTNDSGFYSLTQWVQITHASGVLVSSGDATLRVPEPGALALLGIGLAAAGLLRRRLGA